MTRKIILAILIYLVLGTLIGILLSYLVSYIIEVLVGFNISQTGLWGQLSFSLLFVSCVYTVDTLIDRLLKLVGASVRVILSLISLLLVFIASGLFTFG